MIEDQVERLLQAIEGRYFGKYRGWVAEIDDPLQLGRIKAFVPRLLDDQTTTGWCLPCTPYAGPDQGLFTVPDVGAGVWIEFEGGDLSRPIWTGMWWGAPTASDIGDEAIHPRRDPQAASEIPQHRPPPEASPELPTPHVRILKSSTGHTIVMDDRTGHQRLEVRDASGNRVLMSESGVDEIAHNRRERIQGGRNVRMNRHDRLHVGGSRTVHGGRNEVVDREGRREATIATSLDEKVNAAGYRRKITSDGVSIVSRGVSEEIGGSHKSSVTGAASHHATQGYAISSGAGFSVTTLGSAQIFATMPELPSLDAVSIGAGLGNISVNTFIGFLRLGGMSAISPLVLGDGLMIHHTMLALVSRAFFPPAALGYGPAMDAWAALTLPLDISLFAMVKRFPVG